MARKKTTDAAPAAAPSAAPAAAPSAAPAKANPLAARFKAAIAAEKSAADLAREDHERRLAEASRARDELLGRIAAFCAEIGVVGVQTVAHGLLLSYEDRLLELKKDGPADRVEVGWPGQTNAIRQDGHGTWVLEIAGRAIQLFDDGLVEILVDGLGLPRPADDGAAAPAPAPAARATQATAVGPTSPPPAKAAKGKRAAPPTPPVAQVDETAPPTVTRSGKDATRADISATSPGSRVKDHKPLW